MTRQNRNSNSAAEIKRAKESLKAAKALEKLGLHADAISRAYYAAFHALRALLFSHGLEPKTHAGAIHLFNMEFVRTGVMSSAYNRLLGSLQKARELADYDAAVVFTKPDAKAEIQEAERFLRDAQSFLRK